LQRLPPSSSSALSVFAFGLFTRRRKWQDQISDVQNELSRSRERVPHECGRWFTYTVRSERLLETTQMKILKSYWNVFWTECFDLLREYAKPLTVVIRWLRGGGKR
jgi:hypothetical protein